MNKQQIIDLIRSQEKELYANLQECKSIYGSENHHTRFALGAWGAVLNLLETIETIEEYENN
jgi:hypothetical protein